MKLKKINDKIEEYKYIIWVTFGICAGIISVISILFFQTGTTSQSGTEPSQSQIPRFARPNLSREYAWFRDSDGDGFGDPSAPYRGTGAPSSGFVRNKDDCYDKNSDAYPGQSNFFAKNRGDGSFDYDCNGVSQRELTISGSCDGGRANAGWDGRVPQPGETGAWLVDCDRKVQVFPPKVWIRRETRDRVQKGR